MDQSGSGPGRPRCRHHHHPQAAAATTAAVGHWRRPFQARTVRPSSLLAVRLPAARPGLPEGGWRPAVPTGR